MDYYMSFDPQQELLKTSFGELKAESMTPIIQISAEYGILDQVITIKDPISGTTSTVDNKFTCQTGTDPNGSASILTLRQLKYRAGQGALARLTAIFSPGVADSVQAVGLLAAENSFAFGFIGTEFGIIYTHDGEAETQELTITVDGTGVATITIDGTGFPVTLTAGTVQHNAFEIANSLNLQVPNYIFTSNDNQVVAQSFTAEPMGAFGFTGSTATAAWVQIVAAKSPIVDFIAQEDWNVDTRISTDQKENLDPLKGNIYQVQYQYLGFGGIRFYIEDRETSDLILVHTIEFANSSTFPSVTNPTFRIGWSVNKTAGATNITVSGSSAGAFVEGKVIKAGPQRSRGNDQLAIGAALTNVITFRVRASFAGKVNRSEVIPLTVRLSTQSNKFTRFEILGNPVFADDLDFSYVDKEKSLVEIATDKVGVSGGVEVDGVTLGSSTGGILEFNTRDTIDTSIFPGQTFTIAAFTTSGSPDDCQATATWVEDF